jgi:hypothetical protein
MATKFESRAILANRCERASTQFHRSSAQRDPFALVSLRVRDDEVKDLCRQIHSLLPATQRLCSCITLFELNQTESATSFLIQSSNLFLVTPYQMNRRRYSSIFSPFPYDLKGLKANFALVMMRRLLKGSDF